jgi:hypothetical protein
VGGLAPFECLVSANLVDRFGSYADRHVENPYDRTWSIAAARFIVQFTFKQSLRP